MAIRIACPKCQAKMAVPESVQGKQVHCPKCGQKMQIPNSAAIVAKPKTPSAAKPPSGPPKTPLKEAVTRNPPPLPVKAARQADEPDAQRRRKPARADRDDVDRDRRPKRPARRNKAMLPWILAGVGGVTALVVAMVVIVLANKSEPAKTPLAGLANHKPLPKPVANPDPVNVVAPAPEAPIQQALIPKGEVPREIDPGSIRRVKKATVFLRVRINNGKEFQGSGFFAAEKGLVFTNAHVIGMLNAANALPTKVEIITDSGETTETSRLGRVLCVDREHDLAALRVQGDTQSLPDPLPVDTTRNLTELQSVYIFGFPFGTSLGKNITVSGSTISSIRKEADGTVYQVQVNGGMNHGNSGGPVVDARGVVIGVSVAIIEGTQLNFAVPGDMVLDLLRGRVSNVTLGEAYVKNAHSRVPVEVACLDPLDRLSGVDVEIWAGKNGPVRPVALQQPPQLPGDGPHQSTALSYCDSTARAEVELPTADGTRTFWLRPILTGRNGHRHWGAATSYKMADFAPVELEAVVLQHQFDNHGDRTVKFGNVYKRVMSNGGKQVAIGVNLEMEAVETAQRDPRGGQFRLFAVKPSMSLDIDGKRAAENPQLQALNLLKGRTFSFITNPSGYMLQRSVPTFRSARNRNLTVQFEDLTMDISNAFEMTLLSLPNRSVAPRETWDARVPFFLQGFGNRKEVVDMMLKCTLMGARTVAGQKEAVINLHGDIVKRSGPRRFAGKVSGKAYFLVDKGFFSQVRLKKEAAGLDDSQYVEIKLTRSFGNTTGATPPPLAPPPNIVKGTSPPAPMPAAGPTLRPAPPGAAHFAVTIPGDMFSFLKNAVKDKRLADVDIRGFTLSQSTYRQVSPDGGVLIGFEVGYRDFFGKAVIDSVRPLFKTATGEKKGQWIGRIPIKPTTVKAKQGYAVAGISISTGLGINGFSMRFMKLTKEGLNVDDGYEAPWVGTNADRPMTIGGTGVVAVGVCGHLDNNGSPCSLGVVVPLLPRAAAAAPTKQNAPKPVAQQTDPGKLSLAN